MRSSEGRCMMPAASKQRSDVTRSVTASGSTTACLKAGSIPVDNRRDTRRSMDTPGLHRAGVHVTSACHIPNEVFPVSLNQGTVPPPRPQAARPRTGFAARAGHCRKWQSRQAEAS